MRRIDTRIDHPSATLRRGRPRKTVAALVAVAALTMTACAGDEDATTDTSAVSQAADDAVEAVADGAFEEAPAEDAPATGGVASAGLPDALDGRDIITSVNLSMSTSDVRQTTEDIRRVAATSGGVVFSSDVFLDDIRDDGSIPGGGQIVIKVPPADLDRLVTDLDGVGVVTRLSQDAQDVTDQLVDLDIRIRQAEAGIARIELLLEEATALDDVFAIENELNERQIDLERLRAAERNTDNLVDLATLTIQVEYRTPDALLEDAEPDDGIGDAFADGWGAFVGAIFALGYVLAITAPFLLTGLFVVMAAWLIGRRWSRRRATAHEQRRLDADLPGDRANSPVRTHRTTPPPPIAAERIPDVEAATEAEERSDGDTLVDSDGSEPER